MALTPGWQQYASTAPIIPIDKAFPLAAPGTPTSTAAKPTGMDPFSAVLGVANIGTSIAGLFGQKSAAEQQAEAVEAAAEKQAAAVEKASKLGAEMQLAQVGLNFLESRYKPIVSALERGDATRSYVQRANIEANNPSLIALRSVENFDQRLREAFNKAPVGWRDDRLSFM